MDDEPALLEVQTRFVEVSPAQTEETVHEVVEREVALAALTAEYVIRELESPLGGVGSNPVTSLAESNIRTAVWKSGLAAIST